MNAAVVLLPLLLGCCALVSCDQLLLVQALWRHGDRSPASTYPKDRYQDDTWPQGWGQLSPTGMEQSFKLGAQLRAMYSTNYISASYKPSEIYVRSTDVDRTLMSAMSNLAGFYQNGSVDIAYPNSNSVPAWPSNWSPIPVHTFEFTSNRIWNPFVNCPRADQLFGMIQQSDIYKEIVMQNQMLFDYLSFNTGMKVSLGFGIHTLQDVLSIEKIYNLEMPEWLTEPVWNAIVNLTQIAHNFNFGIFPLEMPELIKLRGGSLLKAVINEMKLKLFCLQNPINNSSTCRTQIKRKYFAYSAHDLTLAALLTTLDAELLRGRGLPQYAACIIVELWNTVNGPQVKILYRPAHNTTVEAITKLIKGCPDDSNYCPFDTFVKRSEIYLPTDIKSECRKRK